MRLKLVMRDLGSRGGGQLLTEIASCAPRQLPATFADAHGLPSGDRIRGQPHGDIAALDQRSFVCRLIPDVVFCLVLWVHSRLHVEIMHLLSPRWPGGRSWLTEGAGSVHQRVCRESPVKGDKRT